ncbi:alanine and arginine-rich domain-containing protein [Ochotona princeps]|uniref:alanine and arginine-rich domain-containing protein n=1 Tax=Ochotona princeps TaxID=9978 RepID=UPI002715409F|nr:alanine and arginine-rich domain-containing protein [Ochotona princeps]
MRPEDESSCKEEISRVCPEEPGGAGLWYPAPGPVRGFPRGSRSRDLLEQNRSASLRLEDLRRRLLRAFQRAVPRESLRRAREEAEAAAREEQSRERVEGALAGLRAELLEMRFQNRQLARTLLDLNMKMQQLKKEYELEVGGKSRRLEDNAVDPENGNAHLNI